MKELKPTFDLLYERKRLLRKDLESVDGAILALQTKCDHVIDEEHTLKCSICGKYMAEELANLSVKH